MSVIIPTSLVSIPFFVLPSLLTSAIFLVAFIPNIDTGNVEYVSLYH